VPNLAKAELGGAKFRRADLAQADISGANLAAARNLTQEQLERAHGSGDTWLPRHIVAGPLLGASSLTIDRVEI
jgi:uncharacterized protein YjbI with pentapeptide repeats